MTVKEITPTELSKIQKSEEAMLIDVREPAEYRGEHIEYSVSIPLGTLNASNLPSKKINMCLSASPVLEVSQHVKRLVNKNYLANRKLNY